MTKSGCVEVVSFKTKPGVTDEALGEAVGGEGRSPQIGALEGHFEAKKGLLRGLPRLRRVGEW